MPPIIRFTRGVPPAETLPVTQLAECAAAVLERHGSTILQYGNEAGFPPLRAWLAEEAGVDASQVLVGQGSLQLLDLLARVLLRPGALVYIEDPSYDFSLNIFQRTGACVTGIPLEGDGPNLDMLEQRLEAGERPVLFYIIPDFQNPSGVVISAWKRQRLAALAERYGFWIVEDVPYRKLRYWGSDLPTLLELAPERTVQLSSYSKLISPGLRVGFAILPPALAPLLFDLALHTYINPSYLNQAIVFEYTQRGWLGENLPRLKALYRSRLEALLAGLEEELDSQCSYHHPQGGFFIGIHLNADLSMDELLASAEAHDLMLLDGRCFFTQPSPKPFIRLPFSELSPEEIRTGVARLADTIREVTLNQ